MNILTNSRFVEAYSTQHSCVSKYLKYKTKYLNLKNQLGGDNRLHDHTIINSKITPGQFSEKILLAKNNKTEKIVVLKYLKPHKTNEQERSTKKELEILKQLTPCHENLACYVGHLEADEDNPNNVIITEYIQGKTLTDVLKNYSEIYYRVRKTNNKIKTVKKIYTRLAKLLYRLTLAIKYLHDNNFVHRDIHPNNIMVSKKKPIIIDYGFTCKIGTEKTNYISCQNPEESSKFITNIYYNSPEILIQEFKEKKYISGDSTEIDFDFMYKMNDLWALAVVMYKCFNFEKGQPLPFTDKTKTAIISYLRGNESETSKIIIENISDNDYIKKVEVKNKEINDLLNSMFNINPLLRPSIEDVLKKLYSIISSKIIIYEPQPEFYSRPF